MRTRLARERETAGGRAGDRAAPAPVGAGPAAALLRLQRTVGNARVQRILVSAREAPGVLRRTLTYVQQETDAERVAGFRRRVDEALTEIDAVAGRATGPEAADLQAAAATLRRMNGAGRVTFWHTSGELAYASYDPGSGEVRVHVNFGNAGFVPSRLLHEAVHAVHAARHPGAAREYARIQAAGGTTDERAAGQALRYRAWTEYWAYRRQEEYQNLRQTRPEFRTDAHRVAMETPAVRDSVARVRELTGQAFDPGTWAPPAASGGPGSRPRAPAGR
ncbi:MAG TPA: hypothetical protein VF263_23130 [Longimicrobiaceae bacterium]